jgi:hypothetical protein
MKSEEKHGDNARKLEIRDAQGKRDLANKQNGQ